MPSPKRTYLIIIGLIALAHWPLLLMDGIYWDDWIFKYMLQNGDRAGHFLLWDELGLPGYAPVYWLIGNLTANPVFAHNYVTLLLLIVSALLIFQIGKLFDLSDFESGIIAVISSAYCALETTFVFNVTVYYLMLTAFIAAVLIALLSKKETGKKSIALRIISLVLFVFSFQHNSLLVFYGAFVLLMLLFEHRKQKLSIRDCLWSFPKKHLDYFILPFAFWLIDTRLHPRVEYYNRINFSWHNIKSGTLAFISKGLMEQLREVVREISKYPAVWCAFVIAGVATWWKTSSRSLLSKRNIALMILFCGIILFVFGTAPYIIVSKGARAHGYTTRHALLVALPVGVMVLGVIKLLWQRGKIGSLIATILMSTALAGSVLAFWGTYHRWQVRWVKDRSVITYFENRPELKSIGTYIVEDAFKPTVESYRYYEWAGMIRDAWGIPGYLIMRDDESFETIAEIEAYHPHWQEWYNLEGYPQSRCKANLFIHPGTVDVMAYMKTRFFGTEEEMKELLRKATEIDLSKFAGCS